MGIFSLVVLLALVLTPARRLVFVVTHKDHNFLVCLVFSSADVKYVGVPIIRGLVPGRFRGRVASI